MLEITRAELKDKGITDSTNVIVYTMGKVGSKTITNTLKKANISFYDVHSLRLYEAAKAGHPILDMDVEWVKQSLYLGSVMEKRGGGRRWKVITLVRDVMSRRVSDRFHQVEKNFPHFRIRSDDDAVREAEQLLVDPICNFDFSADVSSCWFDGEMKETIGLDVFREDFDKTTGYGIYSTDIADVLVIKLEKLSECYGDVLGEFLGLRDVQLRKDNIAEQKSYGDLYRKVLNSICFPEELLETIYGQIYSRHFYSDQEIAWFKEKWTGRQRKREDLIVEHGRGLINSGCGPEVFGELVGMIGINPDTFSMYNRIGRLCVDSGQSVFGLKFFLETLKTDPFNRGAVAGAAGIMIEGGREDMACKLLGPYIEQNPRDEQLKELLCLSVAK